MSRRQFVFEAPDRFVAGTVGLPGQRTFFLQARNGGRIVSVSLEKVQVAVLADRLGKLVDELERRGIKDLAAVAEAHDMDPLDEPINEAFRVGSLTLGWDADTERFIVEARAVPDEHDHEHDHEHHDEDDIVEEPALGEAVGRAEVGDVADVARALGVDPRALAFGAVDEAEEDDDDIVLHVALTAAATRSFVERAVRVVGSGRPPCPLCGAPLDATGHICPRGNGHYVN